jgi:TPR repeat protein
MMRLPAFLCACICLWAGGRAAGQGLHGAAAGSAAASVGNIDVRPRADGLTIAITVSGTVTPKSDRASNPDRLIFDFPGYELRGANRHITVNSGPVKGLRASLFSAHPAVTRVVVDSTEPLNFQLQVPGNGTVLIEIPFPKSDTGFAASASSLQNKLVTTEPGAPPIAKAPATTPPGAYRLLERARELNIADLQPLEDRAQAGEPEAQTLLALAYHAGVLLKKDDVEATKLLHKAADRGYSAAEESLGIFAETGIGMDRPSLAEALNWYRRAAQQGSIDAATDIALLYANGKGVPRNPEQAVVWFRRAAEGGDPSAQYNLGLMYERGEGVPRDYREAIRWFAAAADQKLIPPLLSLAELYVQPPNAAVTADLNKAMQYYQRAADLGSPEAEVSLGTIYSKGLSGKVDYDQAAGWYRKAADKGYADGEFALGVSYAMGRGVPVDYAQARHWLEAAANQGQVEAQYDLAIMCEQGNGAAPDRGLAAHYYEMAADRGMAKAQYRYGLMLAKGRSSGSDRVAAYKWLTLAGDAVKENSGALEDVKKSMSPQEIAQADQEVANWRAARGGPRH